MDKKATADRLRALAADDAKRPKAARLRDVYEDVEATLAAGVPQHLVVAALKEQGLDMTLATFQTTLKRIRAKFRHQPRQGRSMRQSVLPAPSRSPAPAPASREPASSVVESTHKSVDLDTIMSTKPDLNALAKAGKRSRQP